MVERFNIKSGFPTGSTSALMDFSERLNRCSRLTFSIHAKEDKLSLRTDMEQIANFASIVEFDVQNIFEFYRDTRGVSKACFRFPYSLKEDIILVVSRELLIVTVYFNKRKFNILGKTINRRIECRN